MTKKDAKILIMSNEKWMAITCRIYKTNIVKFDQMAFSMKIDAFWSCAIDADFFFC